MPEVDADLADHCLEDLGSVNTRPCPIIAERTRAMAECEGLAPTDKLFEFAVQATVEAATAKKSRRRELWGQIDAFCYSVALIRNPYVVDYEKVKSEVNGTAAARMEAEVSPEL